MKYVLDASSALKWVLPEPLADKARQLRDNYRNSIHELSAPDIFSAEVAHALARAERRKIIGAGEAISLFADVMTTAPRFHSHRSLLPRALFIASQMKIGVYDCLYVALAEQQQCELITADERMVRNLQVQFPFVRSLSSLP